MGSASALAAVYRRTKWRRSFNRLSRARSRLPRAPRTTYLATIAKNLVIDRGRVERREGKRRGTVADIDTIAAPEETTNPGIHLEERELKAIVDAVKRELKEPEASIFRLRFEARLGRREVAEALGITPVMIRRREEKLRETLLIRLRQAGFLADTPVTIKDRFLRRRKKGEVR